MQLTGLPIETVAWLAALSAVVITVLYVLKLRKRKVEIPFSPLWGRVLAARKERTDWWRRLQRLLSWLLHLVLAALLATAMLGPHFEEEAFDERHILVLIDNSASMNATDVTGGHSRFDVALDRAEQVLDSVGGDDRVMVAFFNNRVQPLGPFVDDATLLEGALQDIEPTANPVDLTQALAFAGDNLRERQPAELVVITDGAGYDPDNPPPIDVGDDTTVRHLAVGEGSENLAITAFSARRYPSNRLDHELFVEVRSFFDRPVDATLELSADGRLIDAVDIELDENGVHRQFYTDQAAAGERLEARIRLETPDARDIFPLDDRAYAVIPPPVEQSVQLVSTGNLFVEGPLLLSNHVDLHRIAPDDYDADAEFDVTIFDRIAPTPPATGSVLYLDPPAQGSPFEAQGREENPVVTDVRREHPLMRWITLANLNIGESQTFAIGVDDTPVVAAYGQPIVVARDDAQRRQVAIGFDVRNSDFPLRVSFPIFMLNILDFFADDDVSLARSYTTGQTWEIPIDSQAESATMIGPDGSNQAVATQGDRALFYGETAGFYELSTDLGDHLIAANMANPQESNIAPQSLAFDEAPVTDQIDDLLFDRRQLWIWLLLAALALLLLEWFTFNRRWTV